MAELNHHDLRRFCHLETRLPSIEEIKASENTLSRSDASARVVRLSEGLVAKYGHTVCPEEAETLAYISANTKVPVPRVFASFSELETGVTFIIMEYVRGVSLQSCMQDMNTDEKSEVESLLTAMLANLRCLPSPGYIGSIGRKRCSDSCFWVPEDDPAINGPFHTGKEMLEGILLRLQPTQSSSHMDLLRELMFSTFSGPYDVVFTHGDFQPKNIMVHKVIEQSGSARITLTVIDWETSGWYPEYWEFCNAAASGRHQNDWLNTVRRIMHHYLQEYLMMHMVRSMLFW